MCTRPYLAFLRNAHFEMCSRRRMPQGFRNAPGFAVLCDISQIYMFTSSLERSAAWLHPFIRISSNLRDGVSLNSSELMGC